MRAILTTAALLGGVALLQQPAPTYIAYVEHSGDDVVFFEYKVTTLADPETVLRVIDIPKGEGAPGVWEQNVGSLFAGLPEGGYRVFCRAVDKAANVSAWVEAEAPVTVPDLVPPQPPTRFGCRRTA